MKLAMWQEYTIGNALRGSIVFKARSVNEAWERGRKMFNSSVPPRNKLGRYIILQVEDLTPVTMTTPWVLQQNKLPKDKRAFSNHREFETVGLRIVAYGMSGEKLIPIKT